MANVLPIPQNFAPVASAMWGTAVTPSNTVNFTHATTALYVGVTGDISVVMNGDGATVVLNSVPVGWYWLSVARVNLTGTTATNIVAFW